MRNTPLPRCRRYFFGGRGWDSPHSGIPSPSTTNSTKLTMSADLPLSSLPVPVRYASHLGYVIISGRYDRQAREEQVGELFLGSTTSHRFELFCIQAGLPAIPHLGVPSAACTSPVTSSSTSTEDYRSVEARNSMAPAEMTSSSKIRNCSTGDF
jgi:hypothetical protein